MKLAWLCYYEEYPEQPEILFEEPDRYNGFNRIVPIVFAEVLK